MYFENRTSQVIDLTEANIEDQVNAIFNLEFNTAVKIDNIFWVNDDTSSDSEIREAAVLYFKNDNFHQFESITLSWSKEKNIKAFISLFKDTEVMMSDYNLNSLKPIKFNHMVKEVAYIEFLNKEKNFCKDIKYFYGRDVLEEAKKWGKENLGNFNLDMIHLK